MSTDRTTSAPRADDPGGSLLKRPDFRRYWTARMLSSFGNLVTLVALPVLVYRLSGSAFLTALVTSLEAVPYVLFGLFAGALSDRLDRRRVMVDADLLNAVLVGSLPVAHQLGALTVPHVMVVAFTGPAVGVFFDGANFGALPMLVGRRRIGEANSLLWGTISVLDVAAPTVVGLALVLLHPAELLWLDAASFLASAWLVRSIAAPLHDADRRRTTLTWRSLLADIREGLVFLVRHAGVRTMTVVNFLQCVAGGGFVALMVVWCDRVLDIGTEGWRFGLVFGAWGIGGILGSAILTRVLRRRASVGVALRVLPLSAALGVAAALAPTWPLAVLGLLAWGTVYTMVAVTAISYRQEVTPEPLLGRVNTAGRMLSWGLGWTFGALLGGTLGRLLGVRPALCLMTGVVIGIAAVVAWLSPLRRSAAASVTA